MLRQLNTIDVKCLDTLADLKATQSAMAWMYFTTARGQSNNTRPWLLFRREVGSKHGRIGVLFADLKAG